MRVFLNRRFARFARKKRLPNSQLCEALDRAERGLIDDDLGGGVIRQRVARQGRGRSGGYRAIIAFRRDNRAFFVRGFAKNERDNIEPHELHAIKEAASELLGLSDAMIETLIERKALLEIDCRAQDP